MTYTRQQTKPVLNIVPITVPNVTLKAGVLPYDEKTGDDDLNQLRTANRGTHAIARNGNRIVCLPRTENASMVGKEPLDVQLKDNLGLAGALLRETLIDHFHGLQRTLTKHRPITFLGQNDLLKEALPKDLSAPPWLALLPRYEVDVRVFFFSNQDPFLGLALDSRTRRRITAPVDELIAAGIKVKGLYVGKKTANEDPRFDPKLDLIGRVSEIRSNELELDDAREGVSSIKTGECYLEPSSHTFRNLLEQLFADRAEEVHDALFQTSTARRVGPAKLQEIRKVIGYLQRQTLQISHGVQISIKSLLEGNTLPKLELAPRPVYVFDPTGAKTDTWNDGGLRKYGPYSQQTFSKNHPRIAVICQASAKGRVEQFLHKFFNGQRHPKNKNGPFDNGLIGKYRLEGVTPKFFCADNSTVAAYQRAAQAAQEAVSGEERWDIALVQIEKEFRNLEGAANPYFVIKHAFLTHQTPVQEFTLETASLWEGQLAYALNNMALATYSKLGGTPWLLRCDRAIAHELVIGVGSAKVGEGRLGDRERVVGFTTVFSGDGDYRLANRSQVVPYERYGASSYLL